MRALDRLSFPLQPSLDYSCEVIEDGYSSNIGIVTCNGALENRYDAISVKWIVERLRLQKICSALVFNFHAVRINVAYPVDWAGIRMALRRDVGGCGATIVLADINTPRRWFHGLAGGEVRQSLEDSLRGLGEAFNIPLLQQSNFTFQPVDVDPALGLTVSGVSRPAHPGSNKRIGIVKVTGPYPLGSAGRLHGRMIDQYLDEFCEWTGVDWLVIDCRQLQYSWGDDLHLFPRFPLREDPFIVVSPESQSTFAGIVDSTRLRASVEGTINELQNLE